MCWIVEFRSKCAHEFSEDRAIDQLIDCDTLLDDYLYPDAECFKLEHTTVTLAPPSES